jgi:oligosaccharide repeat unit polymerase
MDLFSLYISITLGLVASIYFVRLGGIFNPVTGFFLAHAVPIFAFILISNTDLKDTFQNYESLSISDVSKHYFLSCTFFLLPWLILDKKNLFRPIYKLEIKYNLNSKNINRVSFILLVNLLISFYLLDGIPILQMLSGTLNIEEHLNNLKLMPFGLMAIQTSLSMLLVLLLVMIEVANTFGFIKKYWLPIMALIISCVWQSNRQLILFLVFSYFSSNMIADKSRRLIRPKKIFYMLLLSLIFITAFVTFQYIRLNGNGASPYEFLAYLTMPELNYQSIIDERFSPSYEYPNYLLTELIPNRFRPEDNYVYIKPFLYEPTSPGGYLFYWYLDYGLIGVAIGSLCAGFISKYFFVRRFKSKKNLTLNTLSLYACFTSGIYSHYISLNNFIIPITFIYIFFFFSRTNDKV